MRGLKKEAIVELFERLFEAEREGNSGRVKVIRAYIDSRLKGSLYISLFIKTIKEKPVYRSLLKVLKGEEIDDFSLSLFVSSMITHQLIECKQWGLNSFLALKIEEQTQLLLDFMRGVVVSSEVCSYYGKLFEEMFDSKDSVGDEEFRNIVRSAPFSKEKLPKAEE